MDAQRPTHIMVYAKPGCHLCDDVLDHLEALGGRWPLQLHVVDITQNLGLHRLFWDKIPVVEIGSHRLHAPIALDTLTDLVAEASQNKHEAGA